MTTQLAQKNQSMVPANLVGAVFRPLELAVSNVQRIESYYPVLSFEQKKAISTYLHASTVLLKDYEYNPKSPFLADFKAYLQIHCGFNLVKIDKIDAQIIAVLQKVGKTYPDIGLFEVFDAIDFCISKKPEMCKAYDPKEGQSSFTTVWLAQILDYYSREGRVDFRPIIAALVAPIEKEKKEIDLVMEKNLLTIKTERYIRSMVLLNIGSYIYTGGFLVSNEMMTVNKKPYLYCLYENMIYLGLIEKSSPGVYPYQKIWDKWKDKTTIPGPESPAQDLSIGEKVKGYRREIITTTINKILSQFVVETETEWIEDKGKMMTILADTFGFMKDVDIDIDKIDLSVEMNISEMFEKYGNKIISLFPLQEFEVRVKSNINPNFCESLVNSIQHESNTKF